MDYGEKILICKHVPKFPRFWVILIISRWKRIIMMLLLLQHALVEVIVLGEATRGLLRITRLDWFIIDNKQICLRPPRMMNTWCWPHISHVKQLCWCRICYKLQMSVLWCWVIRYCGAESLLSQLCIHCTLLWSLCWSWQCTALSALLANQPNLSSIAS